MRTHAEARVAQTPELQPYRDLLLDYGWTNQDEHLAWVACAPVEVIVQWCEAIRLCEQAEAEAEAAAA